MILFCFVDWLLLKVILQLLCRIRKIFVAYDVVPVGDSGCFVSAQPHRHPFRNSGTNHVANGSAT
jgi:hypothetical protein